MATAVLVTSCDNNPQSQTATGSPKEGTKKVLILSSSHAEVVTPICFATNLWRARWPQVTKLRKYFSMT